MFESEKSSAWKAFAVGAAIALLLIPTGLLIKSQTDFAKYQHQVVAAFYVKVCDQSVLFAVTGNGVINPIDNPDDKFVDNLAKSVDKLGDNHVFAVNACTEAAPQQQTYLHR